MSFAWVRAFNRVPMKNNDNMFKHTEMYPTHRAEQHGIIVMRDFSSAKHHDLLIFLGIKSILRE